MRLSIAVASRKFDAIRAAHDLKHGRVEAASPPPSQTRRLVLTRTPTKFAKSTKRVGGGLVALNELTDYVEAGVEEEEEEQGGGEKEKEKEGGGRRNAGGRGGRGRDRGGRKSKTVSDISGMF